MRLLLINPTRGSKYRTHSDFKIGARLIDKMYFAFPLALPTIAGLTPPDVDVSIVDEEIEPIDFNANVDIIGITAMTCKANRAYEIADEFRKRGKYVIMGGIHASMLPEEALSHVNTVVVGEAEGVWPQVIQDYKDKSIKQVYNSNGFMDLNNALLPRRDLIKNDAYSFHMIQTARGCPFQCTFCSVQKFNGRKVRLVDIEKISRELEQIINLSKSRFEVKDKAGNIYDGFINLFITDDNFTINRAHAHKVCSLLDEMSNKHRVKIQWMTHSDISVANDSKMLEALSSSGCVRLFVGFESLDDDNLAMVRKNTKKSDNYSDAIHTIYSHGIDIVASFIIGNDFDNEETVKKLVGFVDKNCLYDVLVSILTPYPGTDIFLQFEKENRLISKNWSNYDFGSVVFAPRGLSVNDLLILQNGLFSNIFDTRSMYKTLIRREKEFLNEKNRLFFAKPPNKFFVLMYMTLKASKILRNEGMPIKDILPVVYYSVKYAINTDKKFSLQTISGLIHFIDKIHYIYWKLNHDSKYPKDYNSAADALPG